MQCREVIPERNVPYTISYDIVPFVEIYFKDLTKAEQQNFSELLTLPDPTLYQWIIGKEEPLPQYHELIVKLRKPVNP